MSRLIDADSFRQNWLKNGKNEYVYDTNAFLESIDEQPTVDVVPVVRGAWIKVDQVYVKCSFCEKHYYNSAREYSYCPNCGAKMDGDKHE